MQEAAKLLPDFRIGKSDLVVEHGLRHAVLKDPEIMRRLIEIGFFTTGAATPAETAEYLRVQYENWGNVVRQIGIQPE